jgi:nicotinate-nucleotide pyrophosphorylase (carboxylating)
MIVRHADINELELPELYNAIVEPDQLATLMHMALHEDLGTPPTDITSSLLDDPDYPRTAHLRTRNPCTLAGLAALPDMLDVLSPDASMAPAQSDGQHVPTDTILASITAPAWQLLAAERTFLNILCHLSGIATHTAAFVEQTRGTHARIFDTRKTTPGLRALEKYAVRCGGGCSHRVGLHEAIMLKDNHLQGRTATSLTQWINDTIPDARQRCLPTFVEVEVDTFEQLEALMMTKQGLIDIILLDNFTPEQLIVAVALRKDTRRTILFEASGGITLQNVATYARTGVERLAVGAITHSAPSADIGLDFED